MLISRLQVNKKPFAPLERLIIPRKWANGYRKAKELVTMHTTKSVHGGQSVPGATKFSQMLSRIGQSDVQW